MKKSTSTSTKSEAKLNKVELAIKAYYLDGESLDKTAQILATEKVDFSKIQSTIESVGLKNEWLLSDDKIKAKVVESLKGKTISHFLDVSILAKDLDIPQLSENEKQEAIAKFSGVSKSVIKEPAKFKQFHNSGNHGKIADWIKIHPDFTANELHESGLITAPNASSYYDEFLAYREFFRA